MQTNHHPPSFERFVECLRESTGTPPGFPITRRTRLEADLGITGDDGLELLEEMEGTFDVALSNPTDGFRSVFGLKEDQYLFHSEGLNPLALLGLAGPRWRENVHALTVGELFDAVVRADGQV